MSSYETGVTRGGEALSARVQRAVGTGLVVERELGRGGMGVVYLARDAMLDRRVALKVLPPGDDGSGTSRERFLREARTAALLSHPNVVPVYRAEESDGIAWFTMAFVDGESLADRVAARGALPPADAVRILREVAWALAYAHARGVVHRDVKPENVLLERGTGRALVSDFGIARRADLLADESLTRAGTVLGTLHYMSPEQVAGDALDGRSDLYALGVMAYQMLSGRLPFEGIVGMAVLVAHATREVPPLRSVAPEVPQALADAVHRCLAKDPSARFETGEALADALELALTNGRGDAGGARVALPAGVPAVLSEAAAGAIWARAAHLQADALRRLETRRDLLVRTEAMPALGAAAGAQVTPPDGFTVDTVVAAATEAGISAQYVAMALAELPREAGARSIALASPELGISEREAQLFLATDERSLAVSQVVRAAPARVLRTLGIVLQQHPYSLQLRDSVGAHPLDGGVVVFDLPGVIVGAGGAMGQEVNLYWMGVHQQLEAHQLQVTLRPIPGDSGSTEVTLTADLRPGVRRNVRASQWTAGLAGSGVGVGTALVMAKAAGAFTAVLLGPAVAATAATAGLCIWWYRWLYPSIFRKAMAEMEGALKAVSAAVRSQELFGELPPAPIPLPSPRSTDGGGDVIAMGI